jgi:type I restriction enzyme, S subunit
MKQNSQTALLPKGWAFSTIDDISFEIDSGFSFGNYNTRNIGIPHIRPPNITEFGMLNTSELKYVTKSDYDQLSIGDVLVNNTNSVKLVGKTAIISENRDWTYSNLLSRIRTDTSIMNPKWIHLFCDFLYSKGFFKNNCKEHVNQASISKAFLQSLSIPIPPRKEQDRITQKTDKILLEIDLIKKSLEKVESKILIFEQSFLKSAFEGKLTESVKPSETIECLKEKFLQERKNSKEPQDFFEFQTKLRTLPNNWTHVSLDFISNEIISGGTPLKSQKTNFDKNGIPLLKVENIDDDGNISILKDQLRLSKIAHKKQSRSIVKKNDVLFNIVGPPLGVIGFVTEEFSEMNINQALVLVRTIPHYDPKLLFYCLKSPFYYNLMHNMGRGNRQDNIKKTDSELIAIPLIPINHQKIILEKIRIFYDKQKIMKKNIEYSYDNLFSLKLSILKRIFEGKFIPQNPNDESAKILLEKLRKKKALFLKNST